MSHRGPPSGYGMGGGPTPYGAMPSDDGNNNILDQLRPYTSKVEDFLETASEPIKP